MNDYVEKLTSRFTYDDAAAFETLRAHFWWPDSMFPDAGWVCFLEYLEECEMFHLTADACICYAEHYQACSVGEYLARFRIDLEQFDSKQHALVSLAECGHIAYFCESYENVILYYAKADFPEYYQL